MQAEQVDASASYDRIDWLIGVAALFHLRMNFLWLKGHTTEIWSSKMPQYSTATSTSGDARILLRTVQAFRFWRSKKK